ncbi:acetyl-CoA C-acetyltransferase [Lactobacillus sp. LC28-10]|uniref:acetyl-CoA C-acetyltransferase n=1 Tax=Secundilactobacillus angelensis TaxID=2722706 RepID=A0ABX1KXU8_9LACO|nr:acetyl-CoA C-acetyltransferase [Secundilactobacillus angelensis]MCH5462843.1 acetyl-CoA C-acetyltransferase [Secundilactobacillus angelensis]NLR18779.1 acetyl-CoA C-acetyltransferase [Secundilactobacillus angelensis]
MKEVVILSAVRTPIGKMGRQLANYSAVELGTLTAKAAIQQAGIQPETINQTIIGNVLQAGSGQNVARQISLNSDVPFTSTAMTINQVCGSGIKAVRLAQSAIMLGDADVVLVGGTESMSNVPYLLPDMRQGTKYGERKVLDGIEHDALRDAFTQELMGMTAENVAAKYHVSRTDQDIFSLRSHQRAVAATNAGYFEDEIVPVTVTGRSATQMTQDAAIRPDTSIEALSHLKPAFKTGGTVTAGNSAGLNDGASMLVLMDKNAADAAGLNYLAVLDGYQEVGIDPGIMGYAPYYAISQLLKKQGKIITDFDRYELNEAFAAQSVAVSRDLKIPDDRLNVNGGAIALGHPVGASGARILTTLVHDLQREQLDSGVAAICIGGGMGIALSVHR